MMSTPKPLHDTSADRSTKRLTPLYTARGSRGAERVAGPSPDASLSLEA